MTTAVDLSGAVAAILQKYRTVLTTYQQQVTGDPAALRSASQSLRTDADQLTASADAVQNGADTLASSWTGTAYTAYHGKAGDLAQAIRAAASALRDRADELTTQAAALEKARHDVDAIIQWFDNAANQLISTAAHASPWAVSEFQSAAQQLGEQAVALAKQVADLLGKELVGPEQEGFTLFQWATSGHSYGETFSDGLLMQGGGYYQLGPRLSVKPDLEFGEDGGKVSGLELSLLKAGASGSISDGQTTFAGKVDADVDGKAAYQNGDVSLSAEAKLKGELSATDPGGSDKVEGSADAHGKVTVGRHGASEDVGFGRSADLETKGTLEGGGFKLDGMGGVGVGLKDQEALTATLDDKWHLKLGASATVIDVVGVKGSVNLDIDLPKVGNEIASGATWLYNGAASAATAFGETYARAVQDNPMMFVP
jgi:WXG100 family type VII secretion target